MSYTTGDYYLEYYERCRKEHLAKYGLYDYYYVKPYKNPILEAVEQFLRGDLDVIDFCLRIDAVNDMAVLDEYDRIQNPPKPKRVPYMPYPLEYFDPEPLKSIFSRVNWF